MAKRYYIFKIVSKSLDDTFRVTELAETRTDAENAVRKQYWEDEITYEGTKAFPDSIMDEAKEYMLKEDLKEKIENLCASVKG